jgi:hypothetical protein
MNYKEDEDPDKKWEETKEDPYKKWEETKEDPIEYHESEWRKPKK